MSVKIRIIGALLLEWLFAFPASGALFHFERPAPSLQLLPPSTTWRAGPDAAEPQPLAEHSGWRLTGQFRQNTERLYWDTALRTDLSNYQTLEVELSCRQSQMLRRIGIYLRSGDGWFVWFAAPVNGTRKLILACAEAGREGRPAGWHKITGLRISITPAGAAGTAAIDLHAVKASCPPVAVVYGTISAPNQSERNAAQSAARRVCRWLKNYDISHAVLTDEDIIKNRLAHTAVVVLPYNPYPPPAQLRALKSFLQRGGKLLVCYGAEPALAEILGLRLGEYQRADRPGRWSAFAFTRAAPPALPAKVQQESANIRPAWPIDQTGQIIAWWLDSSGRQTKDPAWVETPFGYWMSHILMEGDDANKSALLLGLIGRYRPEIWSDAARAVGADIGKIGPYADWRQAIDGIKAEAAANGRTKNAVVYLQDAQRQKDVFNRQAAAADYQRAVQQGRLVRQTLTSAYAAAQTPQVPELRGVWNHSGLGLYPGDWPRTCRRLKAAGFTTLFPNLLWAGAAHYPSRLVPASESCQAYGDQLRQCAQAAHSAGLAVHLWKICWNLGPTAPDYRARLQKENRLQRTADGETLPWLCPSQEANIAQELQTIREAAETGCIDGVHLDYIRFPGSHACYCPECRRRFEAWLGQRTARWPVDVQIGGRFSEKFIIWRCAQITDFVRRARQLLREINPRLCLSAAVYPLYPECRATIAQDWGTWLQNGLVDFVVPMNYTEDTAEFAARLRRHCALPGATGRIYPGIGVTATESRLTADKAIEQILCGRAQGCRGFVLFDLNAALADEILPVLPLGVTACQ